MVPCVHTLYATQSGRAKACARRAIRILASTAAATARTTIAPLTDEKMSASTSVTSPFSLFVSNGIGASFDDDLNKLGHGSIISWIQQIQHDATQITISATNITPSTSTGSNSHPSSSPQTVDPSVTVVLLLFVSTTGDGEQTETIQQWWTQLYVCLSLCMYALADGSKHGKH
jgi:hypothetical protein